MCSDCNVELVNSLTQVPESEALKPNEELVSVFSTDSQIEANLVKGLLEASDIEVFDQPDMSFYGNFADTLANLETYVLQSDAQRALNIIRESQESDNIPFDQ